MITAETIITWLEEKKCEDPTIISLVGKTDIADSMVIVTGRSAPHIAALTDTVCEHMKNDGTKPILDDAATDWKVIDTGDVLVHIMLSQVRELYQLEKLWL